MRQRGRVSSFGRDYAATRRGCQAALPAAPPRRLDLPVVVHCRDGLDDALRAIEQVRAEAGPLRGVFHCFTGTADQARAVLAAGFYVSLAGIVTFGNSAACQEAGRIIRPDRLLVETDAPYLSPEPVRKIKVNEPAHVVYTLRFLAAIRGLGQAELAERTTENACRLFAGRFNPAGCAVEVE